MNCKEFKPGDQFSAIVLVLDAAVDETCDKFDHKLNGDENQAIENCFGIMDSTIFNKYG